MRTLFAHDCTSASQTISRPTSCLGQIARFGSARPPCLDPRGSCELYPKRLPLGKYVQAVQGCDIRPFHALISQATHGLAKPAREIASSSVAFHHAYRALALILVRFMWGGSSSTRHNDCCRVGMLSAGCSIRYRASTASRPVQGTMW
jgi:hypothetical protein